jgi:outer membrane protein TolC
VKRLLRVVPLVLLGCARYVARPLDTGDVAAHYHARRLDDPAVVAALDSLGVPADRTVWRDWDLAQAAWVLRPERARLTAEIRAGEAARITAGARPQPTIATETEYSFSGSGAESRWGLALSTVFTAERGGKRGARIGLASAQLLATRARAQEEAWAVRWRVREALADQAQAERLASAAARELALTDSVLAILRTRYTEGGVTRSDLARVEAERQGAAAEAAARLRDLMMSRAFVAVDVGLPPAAMDPLPPVHDSTAWCAGMAAQDSLEHTALGSRWEIYRALAGYQVAEAELRLEVAKSWPDVQLGPGLFFDHGVDKWTVAFALPALPFNRNQGPIAEAEARREVAGRRVAEVQDHVLGEVGQAAAGCMAAATEAAALDLTGVREREALTAAAYQRGEVGRLEVAFARLELARAERRLAEAAGRVVAAGLALERAMGIWTGATPVGWDKGDL